MTPAPTPILDRVLRVLIVVVGVIVALAVAPVLIVRMFANAKADR